MEKVNTIVEITVIVTRILTNAGFPMDIILMILEFINSDNSYAQYVLKSNNKALVQYIDSYERCDNTCNTCGIYLHRGDNDDHQDDGNLYFKDPDPDDRYIEQFLCFHCMRIKFNYRINDDTYDLVEKVDPTKCLSSSSNNDYVQSKLCCIYIDHYDGFVDKDVEDNIEYPHLNFLELCSYCYMENHRNNCDHNYDDYDGIIKCIDCGQLEIESD